MRTENFNEILRKSIKETLNELFGESSAKALYYHIRKTSNTTLDEPEKFFEALRKLLGSGAHVVEILTLRKFYSELNLEFREKRGYTFSEYVEEARRLIRRTYR